MSLISKPRYFDLMVQLKDKIANCGDVTIERLIYEDWKDRTRRKKQVDNLDFEVLVSSKILVRQHGIKERYVVLKCDRKSVVII